MILKYVCPDYRVKSIFDISPKWLKRNGYVRVVVDIDNTLLPRDKTMVGPRAMTWIRQCQQMGINVALISNNGGDRIKAITRQTKLGTIMRAAKPLPMAYNQLKKAMGSEKILFVGDQLLTDVLGAKWAGFPVIWVESLGGKEHFTTRCTRKLEKYFIGRLNKNNMMPKERVL